MIERLTDKQIAKFPDYAQKWTDIGLSTAETDKTAAEQAIKDAYAVVGKAAPRVVWCGSPLANGLVRAILLTAPRPVRDSIGDSVKASVGDSVKASVWDLIKTSVRDSVWNSAGGLGGNSVWASVKTRASVWDLVRDSVWNSAGDSVKTSVRDSVGDSVRDSVRDSVLASVGDSIWDSIRDSVKAPVWDSVKTSVGVSVLASVGDSVGDSVKASVKAPVKARTSVWDLVGDSVKASGYGQHDANWLAFYDYFRTECRLIQHTDKLVPLMRLAEHAGWWLPHEQICWVCPKHNLLHMQDNRLHRVGGPALQYPDGWSIWALNGVCVPRWLAETPEGQLDPRRLLKIENAEVRREFVRRVGIERICYTLGAVVLDKQGDYELLVLDIQDGRRRPYLKMLNPSIGTWHVEGVHPSCKTVAEALAWRNGTPASPAILT